MTYGFYWYRNNGGAWSVFLFCSEDECYVVGNDTPLTFAEVAEDATIGARLVPPRG